jgi:hypothetical protein
MATPHALDTFDPYCPICAPDEDCAAQLCERHFIERWSFTPTEKLAAVRLAVDTFEVFEVAA